MHQLELNDDEMVLVATLWTFFANAANQREEQTNQALAACLAQCERMGPEVAATFARRIIDIAKATPQLNRTIDDQD